MYFCSFREPKKKMERYLLDLHIHTILDMAMAGYTRDTLYRLQICGA